MLIQPEPPSPSQEGYREGITLGKESKLQPGFDQGFSLSSPIAKHLGILRALAASLLALLTTAAAAKHATKLAALPSPDSPERALLVAQLREVVTALGRLDENSCLPVDEEAEEHAREHERGNAGGQWDGTSQAKADADEMRDLEEMMGGTVKEKKVDVRGRGLEEARVKLAELLSQCGMEGLVPPPLHELA